MKIKSIYIKSFGPLKEKHFSLCNELNIFAGSNESGKTTMVDLIIREIFRYPKRSGAQDLTPFKGVERYRDEDFAGELVVDHDGSTYNLPEAGKKFKIENLLGDIWLSRLFCIESGDLTLPKDAGFFETLKEKLSGTGGNLDRIKKAVYAKAKLPPSGENTKGSTYYNDRKKIEDSLSLYKDLLPSLAKIHELEESLNEVKDALEELNRAKLKTASLDFKEYTQLKEKIDSPNSVSEDGLRRLSKLIESRERLKAAREEQDKNLSELSNKIVDLEMTFNEKKIVLRDLNEKLNSRAMHEFEEDFQQFIIQKVSHARAKSLESAAHIGWIASFLITLITLVYTLLKGAGSYYVPFIVAIVGGALLLFWKNTKAKGKWIDTLRKRLKIQSSGLNLDTIPNLEEADYNTLASIRSGEKKLEGEVETLQTNLKELKSEIPKKNKELKENEEGVEIIDKKIQEILSQVNLESIETYEAKLNALRSLNTNLVKKKESLGKLLGPDESSWQKRVKDINATKTETAYDPNLYEELSKKKDLLSAELNDCKKPFLQAGCETPHDILKRISECEGELESMSVNLEASKLCSAIFSKIDEKRNKVFFKTLEDKQGAFLTYLSQVLGNRKVKKVFLEGSEMALETESGQKFDIKALSRGAADQLLLSFRLAILRDIFSKAHFLILDDPFLSSDFERRKKLAKILSQFIDAGWQVLYYTFDANIKDLLTRTIKNCKAFNM